jgi:hypothetical protein
MPGTAALERCLEWNWRGQSRGIMRRGKLGRRNYSLHA